MIFNYKEKAVDKSPGYKGPACAVPQTCGEENDELIDICTDFALSVTAQRNIKVFLEPGGK